MASEYSKRKTGECRDGSVVKTICFLVEKVGSVFSTHTWFTVYNSRLRGPDTLFWPMQTLHAHGTQTHRRNTNTSNLKRKHKRFIYFYSICLGVFDCMYVRAACACIAEGSHTKMLHSLDLESQVAVGPDCGSWCYAQAEGWAGKGLVVS